MHPTYRADADLGRHLIESAMAEGFDVAAMKRLPRDETPYAFGFVYRQIMCDRVIPSVPVFINMFYPPNQPPVARCYAFGKSLVRAIQSWPSDARVALIASGGLTHFVNDETVIEPFFRLWMREISAALLRSARRYFKPAPRR